MEAQPVRKPKDFSRESYISAIFVPVPPTGHKEAYGHINATDPITGKKVWEVTYRYPPMASLLATKGDLLFVPGADGMLDALNAKTGKKLWSHNDGIGHDGGIITYVANGKQYLAVTTGWGTYVSQKLAKLYGEPFKSMPMDGGTLNVYALP